MINQGPPGTFMWSSFKVQFLCPFKESFTATRHAIMRQTTASVWEFVCFESLEANDQIITVKIVIDVISSWRKTPRPSIRIIAAV